LICKNEKEIEKKEVEEKYEDADEKTITKYTEDVKTCLKFVNYKE
jgi:hypothetical protein